MSHSREIFSDYLREPLTPTKLKKLVKEAVTLLKPYDFDAIAFRGISGALVAPILAYRLNKSLLVVRKPKTPGELGETAHSCYRVEGDVNTQRYVIVDDFQCSGRTVEAIIKEVGEFAPEAKCLGAVFYREFIVDNRSLKICVPRIPTDHLINFLIDIPAIFRKESKQEVL